MIGLLAAPTSIPPGIRAWPQRPQAHPPNLPLVLNGSLRTSCMRQHRVEYERSPAGGSHRGHTDPN